MNSSDWIPFAEGEYWVEQAVLFTPENSAALMEETTIVISLDHNGKKHMKGSGRMENILMVDLLEDGEDIHLLLDFGGEFKYCMHRPTFFAGKVFSPDVKSVVQFVPSIPWRKLTENEFKKMFSAFEFNLNGPLQNY